MKEDKNDIANELIPKYLMGEATSEEEQRLLDWIAQTEENERRYADLKRVFELSQKHYTKKASENFDIDIEHEWNHFINQINKEKETPIRSIQSDNRSGSIWYKIAASVLILVASAFVVNYFISRNSEIQYQTADNTLSISLPDGSKVSLNKHSRFSYSNEFGKRKRFVTLQGEAFFDVSHDATKPFVILANSATVEVLGTSFNVRAYDSIKVVEVTVKTGVVKLSVPELKKEVKLTAGQLGTYAKNIQTLSRDNNQDINFLAWSTQKIVFEESDLHTVMETLAKAYGVEITLTAEVPTSCIVTVTFDHQTLEAVLRVLENTLNLKYQINGNQIEIISAGC